MEGRIIWDQIEDDKYLLCDHRGLIALLIVESNRIRYSTLGRVEATSVIRYIDNRVIYTGSYSGPSHLLRILSNRLETITAYSNCGPIIDMVAVEGDTKEESQLLGAGGFDSTSAILEIRSGVECRVMSEETDSQSGRQLPQYIGYWRDKGQNHP